MPGKGRDATFGEFGIGFVQDVFTPELLGRHLDAALAGQSFETSWWPNLAWAKVTLTQPGDPTIVGDDRCERVLQVPIAVRVDAQLGTGAASVAATVEVDLDLTLRVQAFAPGTVFLAIDPVAPDDVRIDVKAWSGWDLWAAAASVAVGELVEMFAPRFAPAVDGVLAGTVEQRIVDVLGKVLTSQSSDPAAVQPARSATAAVPTVPPDVPLTGVIAPRESHVWGVWLAAGEQLDADLWAGLADRVGPMSPGVNVALAVLSPSGRKLPDAYEATLHVGVWVPDFVTTAPYDGGPRFTAGRAGVHRLRLSHDTSLSAPERVAYRIHQRRRHTGPSGKRICFDELGDAIVRLGINRDLVAAAIAAQLPTGQRQTIPAPVPVTATVTARLARLDQFVPKGTSPDRQLWYRPVFTIDIELTVGDDEKATVMAATLEARASMRVTTRVEPATIVVAFDPVPDTDVRVVGKPRHVRGRKIPFASLALDQVLPAQVAATLNTQLAEAGMEIVVGEAAAAVPVPPPPERPRRRLDEPARFEGTCAFGDERYHAVPLATGQRVKVKARLAVDREGRSYAGFNVDVAVVDEHGGIHERAIGTIHAGGKRREVVELDFEAPYAAEWRVRLRDTYVVDDAPGFVYEVVVTP